MNTSVSGPPPGSTAGAPRRQSIGSEGSKGEVETRGVDHWTSVAEKLTAEKHFAEDAQKVLVADITTTLRRLTEHISEDNWMYDPIDWSFGNGEQGP